MGKKYYFLFFIIVLSGLILTVPVFAQDIHKTDQICNARSHPLIAPVLSKDCISDCLSKTSGKKEMILIAENTSGDTADSEDDELDQELFEDYENTIEPQTVADPLYYFNYVMYSFNDFLYFAAIKPLATGYKTITPMPIRKGVNNFFHNLLFPVRFINNILQGQIKDAGTEIEIFLINTTIGVLGFGQVAQNNFDLHTSDEDFGQTLGSYSIGNGFYLVLPIFGPSTLRDTLGLVGDWFLTPVTYVDPWELSYGIKAYDTINATTFRLGDYEALKAAALDPYTAIKNAYIQNRKEKLKK